MTVLDFISVTFGLNNLESLFSSDHCGVFNFKDKKNEATLLLNVSTEKEKNSITLYMGAYPIMRNYLLSEATNELFMNIIMNHICSDNLKMELIEIYNNANVLLGTYKTPLYKAIKELL